MESTEISSLLEQLDDEIDDLEDSLAPIVKSALSVTSSKLPLLDKAKLYVLITYAVESLLFSYLRLNGVKAREHPVFKELTRVKQYFGKIKAAEAPSEERPNLSLNKQAVTRVIKAGLIGNDVYDSERAQRQEAGTILSHASLEDSSETTKNATSSPSVANDRFDMSRLGVDAFEARPSRVINPAKKRKVNSLNNSVPASSLSYAGSDTEPYHSKTKKSKNKVEKRTRKNEKKKAKDEGKKRTGN